MSARRTIACAKPTIEEREGIPHHLIDIVEPEADYTVGNFYDDAKTAIEDILSRGKVPIVAGGTGLYFRILLENYNLPRAEADYELREKLDRCEREDLLNELKKLDKVTYERLKESNKRRIVRALEVIKTLNSPLSEMELQKELLKKANNKEAYDEIADQIFKLREQREKCTVDTAARDAQIARINDLQNYIKMQRTNLESFDETLVKRWLKQITVWEDHFTVELKSGLKIDIEG